MEDLSTFHQSRHSEKKTKNKIKTYPKDKKTKIKKLTDGINFLLYIFLNKFMLLYTFRN